MNSRTPFGWFLSLVVTAVVLTVSLVAGAFLAAVIVGLAFLGALGFGARLWWLRWRHGRNAPARPPGGAQRDAASRAVIDAEFHVVEDGDKPERR